jgi:alkanesulfonate monooxygenase SsuD/methylene tetrahydromethanopterin reductase-like flavin-dependent oxidoreductase (luciferase family)
MQIFLFHLMPYADLDLGYDRHHDTAWVTLPNSYFDPVKGHALYNRYLDELEFGEELGYDGLCVNEHHQTAYGLMPSPIVTAAALARRTKTARIAILGSAFGLREHPLTLAEEHAMIDCITGGRLITGMVRGIGAEYFTMRANPALSHARFHEAHDLVIRAWTEPGPFSFEGEHYTFPYVNPWPRPYQQPHPPIWVPSQGSRETIEWAAHPDRKYVYLQTYSPFRSVARCLGMYREAARTHGYEAADDRLGWAAPVYVGETDAAALDQARPHMEAFFNKFLKLPFDMRFPPGYVTASSLPAIVAAKSTIMATRNIEFLMEQGIIVIGGPDTVRRRLIACHKEVGMGNLLTMMQFGTLPADLTRRSMELFAAHVMPALKPLGEPRAKRKRARK